MQYNFPFSVPTNIFEQSSDITMVLIFSFISPFTASAVALSAATSAGAVSLASAAASALFTFFSASSAAASASSAAASALFTFFSTLNTDDFAIATSPFFCLFCYTC